MTKFLILSDGTKMSKYAFLSVIYEFMGGDDVIKILNLYDLLKKNIPESSLPDNILKDYAADLITNVL